MDVVEPAMVIGTPSVGAGADKSGEPATVMLRHRLEYLALRAALFLARRVPIEWVTATGAVLAGLAGPWLRQNRRALANLSIAFPDKSEAERAAIARAMWANMGRLFAETLVLDRIVAQPQRIEVADHAHWQARIGTPGPSIVCTLHMGNWELVNQPFTRFGRTAAAVYKPLDNPLIDGWLVTVRSALYPGGLLGKGDNDDAGRSGQRTARKLIDLARKGGSIGFVMDHVDRRGTPIAFMGREVRFTTAPAMIARHVGARLWVGCCFRVGTASRFRMVIARVGGPRHRRPRR